MEIGRMGAGFGDTKSTMRIIQRNRLPKILEVSCSNSKRFQMLRPVNTVQFEP